MCKVEWCDSKVYAKGYCRRHYEQVRTLGRVKRTRRDPNEVITYEDYAEIMLYDKWGEEVGRTKISLDKVDKAKKYKWRMDVTTGYVLTTIVHNHKTLSLHRYLLEAEQGDLIDHKDRDKLNNMDDNLRFCSRSHNSINRDILASNTSGVTGVYWHSRDEVWQVRLSVDGENMYLGNYTDKEEAIQVRKEAERKYFGEFAPSKKS